MLDLAADRLEVPNLVNGHGTYVGAIKHDNRPARVRRCGLMRRVPDSRDLGHSLPVVRLEPQCDGMGAVRTLSWFAGEASSRVSRIRAPSRNEVRAPSSACTRSSAGMHRAVSYPQIGENSTARVRGAARRQRHTVNRGASTSTVPNRVCSRRVRRSLSGRNTPQAVQAR